MWLGHRPSLSMAQGVAQQLQDVLDGTARAKVLAEVVEALSEVYPDESISGHVNHRLIFVGDAIKLVRSLERGKDGN